MQIRVRKGKEIDFVFGNENKKGYVAGQMFLFAHDFLQQTCSLN